MKKYIVSAIIAFGILASPAFVQAAGLSTSQISAVISLLQAFSVNQTVINNVQSALGGTINYSIACPVWGCNSPIPTPIPTPGSSVQVTSPTTGQSFVNGGTMNIQWTPASAGVAVIQLVSTSGGESPIMYANKVDGDPVNYSGSYSLTVPWGYDGSYYVRLMNPENDAINPPGTIIGQSGIFTITAPVAAQQAPIITSISPNQGAANSTVTIYGNNLGGKGVNPTIQFYQNGTLAGTIDFISMNYISSNELIFNPTVSNSLMPQLTAGTYQVNILTPAGTSNSVNFTFLGTTTTTSGTVSTQTPVITNISPTQGSGSTVITINGSNFTSGGNPAIQFYQNGTLAGTVYFISMNYISSNQLIFNPAVSNSLTQQMAPGTYQVDVLTPTGTSNSLPFTIIPSTINPPISCPAWRCNGPQPTPIPVPINSPTTATTTPTPTVTISANPTTITVGQAITLTWSSTNATACSGTSAGGSWNGTAGATNLAASGSQMITPINNPSLLPYTISYQIICTGPGGTSSSASATAQVNAPVPLCSNPAPACQASPSACASTGSCSKGSCTTATQCNIPTNFGGCGGTWTPGCNGVWTPAQTASVWDAVNGLTSSASNNSAPQTSFSYVWNNNLQIGSPYSADVTALQTALTKEGVYTGDVTGGFYNQTFVAVKAFQQKYGIEATGFVGPDTRAKLNSLY